MAILWFFPDVIKAETWKIAALDWPPYASPDLANQGQSVAKLTKLLRAEGIELEVDFYPWLRAQHYAKKHKYIGYFPAWPEEIKEGFVSSHAIACSSLAIMTHANTDIDWQNIEQLFEHHLVGIVRTYRYPKIIQETIDKYPYNVRDVADEATLVKVLARQQIDAALTDSTVMLHNARNSNLTNIEVLKQHFFDNTLVIGLRNDAENSHRIALFDRLLSDASPACACIDMNSKNCQP